MESFTHFDADCSSIFVLNFFSIKVNFCFSFLVMFSSIFWWRARISSFNLMMSSSNLYFSVLTFIDYFWERIRYFSHAGFDSKHLEFHSDHCLSIVSSWFRPTSGSATNYASSISDSSVTTKVSRYYRLFTNAHK